jgi:hypothetical protein
VERSPEAIARGLAFNVALVNRALARRRAVVSVFETVMQSTLCCKVALTDEIPVVTINGVRRQGETGRAN